MRLFARHRVAELAARYLAEQEPRLKSKTYRELERLWKKEIVPALGELRLSALTEDRIAAWHQGFRRRPYLGNRALNALAHAMNRAERWGWRDPGTNPCRYVRRFPERPRDRYPSAGELVRLGDALRGLLERGLVTDASADAIRALILTGARKQEILRLAWRPAVDGALGWVDLEAGALRYRDSKTGPKVVPLSGPALDLFRRRAASRTGPWVFPGRQGRPLAGIQRAWERACTEAGVEGACPHSLRHALATRLLEAGAPERTVAGLLGQRDLRSTAVYLHPSLSTLRAAADAAGASLAAVTAA